MKYIIQLSSYPSGKRIYYKGTYVHDATPKLSQASIFTSADCATDIVHTIGKIWLPSVEEVTNKELFEARLKGT